MDDDLLELATQAEVLRERLSAFLDDFGELAPPLKDLHGDLAEIDDHLMALGFGNGGQT